MMPLVQFQQPLEDPLAPNDQQRDCPGDHEDDDHPQDRQRLKGARLNQARRPGTASISP